MKQLNDIKWFLYHNSYYPTHEFIQNCILCWESSPKQSFPQDVPVIWFAYIYFLGCFRQTRKKIHNLRVWSSCEVLNFLTSSSSALRAMKQKSFGYKIYFTGSHLGAQLLGEPSKGDSHGLSVALPPNSIVDLTGLQLGCNPVPN